ncbi:MAG TPA: hypothetical protein VEI97_02125, partial [bacterium]|nr:hypothetical protein [bacterium]
ALQPRYNRVILAWSQGDTATARTHLTALGNLTKGDARAAAYITDLLADLKAGKTPAESRIDAKGFDP